MEENNYKFCIFQIMANVPQELLYERRFCLWKYEKRHNSKKSSKIPCYISKSQIKNLNIRNFNKYLTGIEAAEIAQKYIKSISGIGFIITNSNLFSLDLDNCYNSKTKQLLSFANEIVSHFSQTYIEVSPSDKGIRIIGRGKLNLNGKSKSIIQKSIEAYDGSSIRYLTITGEKLGESSKIYNYHEENPHLHWFQQSFFPSYSLNISQTCKIQSLKNQKLSKNLKIIQQRICQSKDAELFLQLCSGQLTGEHSTSEDDWKFCLLVLSYMKQINYELLEEFLFNCRYRTKFDRKDYIQLTISKSIIVAQKTGIIGKNITQKIVNKQDILKFCTMMSNIFHIRPQSNDQEIILKKDDKNYIKFFTSKSLSALDMDNYIGILQVANLEQHIKYIKTSNTVGDLQDMVKISLNMAELSKILQKQDGGKFRRDILQTIIKMSHIYFEYKKVIDKNGNIIMGGSYLLSCKVQDNPMNKLISMSLGINPYSWYIMKHCTYNYSIINVKHRFQLSSIHQRFLYSYLCEKVIPGQNYFQKFYINDLVKILWGTSTKNNNTQKKRKKRLRQVCLQLYKSQEHLLDFKIKLITEISSFQTIIQGISVQRYKVKIRSHHYL